MAVVQIFEDEGGGKDVPLNVRELVLQRAPYFRIGPLNMTCQKGSMTLVTGPNGSGKTTFLRALAGLFSPKKGVISFSCAAVRERATCLLIESGKGLHSALTVNQHLQVWAALSGSSDQFIKKERSKPIEKVSEIWGLSSIQKRLPSTLSQGQKQRVLLARLSLSRHLIWLLDEPFQALDTKGRTILTQVLSEHLGKGGMIIGVCHESSFPHITQKIEIANG